MNTQFSLTKNDVGSLLRGLGISLLAVTLSYIATNVVPMLETSALTPQAALAVMLLSNLVNVAQRFIRNT